MPSYRLERESLQDKFRQCRTKIQIFSGGFGNGKTTASVLKALELAEQYPGSSGLLARETYPKLNDTLRKEFLYWCPSHWIRKRPTQEDNTAYLVNGTIVNFRYVAQKGKSREDGSTTSNLLSATYDWIVVDQIEDPGIQYKDFLDLLGRLRGATPHRPPDGDEPDETMPASGPRWLILTANPNQGWFYREVVQPYKLFKEKGIRSEKLLVDPETGDMIIELFEGSTYTNKANLAPDYLLGLEAAYKGQMKERYLMGKWAAFEGLVHPGYEIATHSLPYNKIMEHLKNCKKRFVDLKVLEGYDFGLVSPSCYLLAFVDDYGRTFVIDGYYRPEYNYDAQPQAIADIRYKYHGLLDCTDRILADPAIFKRSVVAGRRQTGDTVAKLLNELGMETRPATNDITPGIAKVNSYLAGHPKVPHLITGEKPGPLLYFSEELDFLATEFGSYYWKKNPQGINTDEPIDNNDHSMNTLKYLLSFAPQPSEIIVPDERLPKSWMFWHEEDNEAA